METTGYNIGVIGFIYWGFIGIMEKKMETTGYNIGIIGFNIYLSVSQRFGS